ncbi:hypothetical protein B0H10DRAFT_2031074 [Mycena sp. CBHHK59/15]|nr:hypothetical protein B0H10DRAFT_2031074 [Mycena sp. CBHHK59/15]
MDTQVTLIRFHRLPLQGTMQVPPRFSTSTAFPPTICPPLPDFSTPARRIGATSRVSVHPPISDLPGGHCSH